VLVVFRAYFATWIPKTYLILVKGELGFNGLAQDAQCVSRGDYGSHCMCCDMLGVLGVSRGVCGGEVGGCGDSSATSFFKSVNLEL
jgi:hypothetical protein